MWDVSALPTIITTQTGLNYMHELNVRKYLQQEGVPGVWLF
jgi:hypothetical protein